MGKSDFLLKIMFQYIIFFHRDFQFLVYFLFQLCTYVPGDCNICIIFIVYVCKFCKCWGWKKNAFLFIDLFIVWPISLKSNILVIKKYSSETIFKGFKTAGMTNKKLFNELFWIMGSEGHKVWSVGFLYELRITGKEFICQEPSMLWHKSKHHQENSK